jgi:signal transduction histidine kinase
MFNYSQTIAFPSPSQPSAATTHLPDLHSADINRLREQLWIGVFVTTIVVMVITYVVLLVLIQNDPFTLSSQVIVGTLITVCFANLYFLKTHHAQLAQGIYVLCVHLAVPIVLVLHGGLRGFGDLGLMVGALVALLYGWRRWMAITFGIMAVTLAWVFYREIMGDPLPPLFSDSSQFMTIKLFSVMLAIVLLARYFVLFYHGLLNKYQRFADEQVLLNRELQRSRQKIVTAREEERRRLRRDLHDGLGPTLAAQMFRIGVVQSVLLKNPQSAAEILETLQAEIEGTLTHIRQLVYELRPPQLDQLGLSGAVSDFVLQLNGGGGGLITLHLPAQLPPLNAAVEVAAYRIVQTALDNVTRHAQATTCDARLTLTDSHLQIEIIDNGIGIAEKYRAGVGLTSMRERAEELGGTFAITPTHPHGTRLSVSLPLLADAT